MVMTAGQDTEKWIPFDFLNVHIQENLMQLYNCNTINRFNQSDSHCGNFFTLCVETKLKKKKKSSASHSNATIC